jgi:uncharacterized membrane protein YdbT with pleckstrin-like domain
LSVQETSSTYAERVWGDRNRLDDQERVVLVIRRHAKALVWPSARLVVLGFATGAGAGVVPSDWRPAGQVAVAALGLVLATGWVVLPYLRWRTTTYTLTTRRLIARRGVLHRAGVELPLVRVHDVSYDRSLLDRILGCGSLQVQTPADGGIVLVDVPDVERVHLQMTELLFARMADDRRGR